MSDLNESLGKCGFFCCPARWPESGQAEDQRDCDHPKSAHYSIDGDNVGCSACEDKATMRDPNEKEVTELQAILLRIADVWRVTTYDERMAQPGLFYGLLAREIMKAGYFRLPY